MSWQVPGLGLHTPPSIPSPPIWNGWSLYRNKFVYTGRWRHSLFMFMFLTWCRWWCAWLPPSIRWFPHRRLPKNLGYISYTANEGPVRIQYNCLVSVYVFPELKLLFTKQIYNVLSPSSYTHISVRDFYISRISLPILLQEICGPILEIYKSLTDTWMW